MNWANCMAWIMKPVGRPPVELVKYVGRRVKIRPATAANAPSKAVRKALKPDKKDKREILETRLDDLCRLVYKKRDLKDGWGYCISCTRPKLARALQWGHFIAQKQSQYLRWDPRNFAAQCISCNIFEQGRQADFAAALDKRYQPGFAEGLRQEAHRHATWHPSIDDLEKKKTELEALLNP